MCGQTPKYLVHTRHKNMVKRAYIYLVDLKAIIIFPNMSFFTFDLSFARLKLQLCDISIYKTFAFQVKHSRYNKPLS
jgi:hypothetical protein